MKVLLLKLVTTPALIAAATVAARRFGAGVGGWLAGMPLTSGPVSVFLAIEQGPAFAAQAAVGTLLGLIAVTVFCVAYARAADRLPWLPSTLAGLLAFGGATALLAPRSPSLTVAFGAVVASLVAGTLLIRSSRSPAYVGAPRWDLPLRMAAATTVVVTLTALASTLGPRLSGFVSTVPVFAGTMAAFSHRLAGDRAAAQLLRGVVVGSFAFAAFFLVVGLSVERLGLVGTYTLATATTLAINAAALLLVERPGAHPGDLPDPPPPGA